MQMEENKAPTSNIIAWIYTVFVILNILTIFGIERCYLPASVLNSLTYLGTPIGGLIVFVFLVRRRAHVVPMLAFSLSWVIGSCIMSIYILMQDKAFGCGT
jgi:hypothetical protein